MPYSATVSANLFMSCCNRFFVAASEQIDVIGEPQVRRHDPLFDYVSVKGITSITPEPPPDTGPLLLMAEMQRVFYEKKSAFHRHRSNR